MNIKNNSYENLFFIFLFYNTLTAKLDGNDLAEKTAMFLESFVDKTTFNFHLFHEINDFVTTQYSTITFYPFGLNPCSGPYENGMDEA